MEIHVTREIVDEFLQSMEFSDQAWLETKDDLGRLLVPTHVVPKLALDELYVNFLNAHFGKGVFARQNFKFFEAIWIGDRITALARFIDTYEKRKKNYVVFQGEFRKQDGTLAILEKRTIMVTSSNFKIRD